MSGQTLQAVSGKTPQACLPASADLFPNDDLIRSVLDLTHILEGMGVIEIIRQPESGADYYRILKKRTRNRKPQGELSARVGAIFGRKPSTLWGTEEIVAYKQIDFDFDDLKLVEEYYKSEAKKTDNYCRKSLLTFLRHFPGEVDRARRWKETSTNRHCY